MGILDKEQVELLQKGVVEFNEQNFFDCHETLEELWQDFHGAEREMIQGIIQISVAYYHAGSSNFAGALKLMSRGVERVKRYETGTLGLNLALFIEQVSADLGSLEQGAPLSGAIPTIEYISSSNDC